MPPKNRMEDLRNHLFETLEALRDEDKPMDIDRARAVSEVAQTIIDSAKVEVRYLEVTGGESGSALFGKQDLRGIGDGRKNGTSTG